ncbi:MAG: type II toxin-antitoxin system VapC family toxin [Pseudonocardiaceae bacterium]
MIYLDACALLKFIKSDAETEALRAWRQAFPVRTELATSELAQLEITRALLRAGVDHQRVPYITGQALRGVHLVDLTSTVIARAMAYRMPRLGSLDAIHLATADPFRPELTEFVTYDHELTKAAVDLGFTVAAPS